MSEPLRYNVDLSARAQHLVTVTCTVPAELAAGARLVLPTWTPGSYVIRDYVHHLQRITARDASGEVALTADGHSAWTLPDDTDGEVAVELELYANELTVRTNHVDDHHALLIPAATFPYVEGATDRTHLVEVPAPDGWRVWGLIPQDADGTFRADDFDHLVDSAFEVGAHEERTFDVAGVPHRFVWAGHGGRPDLDRIVREASQVCEAAVAVFDGDLPTDAYTFLCEAFDQGGGGLEHRDGTVLALPVHAFRDPEGARAFATVVAHEYFHLWNVKRLTPAALTRPDYEHRVHTPSLWVAEGWTAYYDELLTLRAEVWKPSTYFEKVGELVQRVLERPAAALQSVRQASHEAWTKFYVRDENWPNATVSYYEHGAVLAWSLDLLIRRSAPDGDGLDAVLRLLWERYGRTGQGYEEADVEAAATEIAGTDLSDFFDQHVAGTAPPPIRGLVDLVGLRFTDQDEEDEAPTPPDLGVETTEDDQGVLLRSVLRDRPAWRGGLTGGDRLLAIDGTRVGRGDLPKALRGYAAGDTIEVTVFRGPRLVTATVELGDPRPKRKLAVVDDPSDAQRDAFRRWAHRDLPTGS